MPLLLMGIISIAGCSGSGGEGSLDGGENAVSASSPKDISPLMKAVERGDTNEIERLLREGGNINETN